MLALMVITSLVMNVIVNSKFGYGIRSIKANEDAANSMRINTTFTKVSTWAIEPCSPALLGDYMVTGCLL